MLQFIFYAFLYLVLCFFAVRFVMSLYGSETYIVRKDENGKKSYWTLDGKKIR